MKFPGSWLRFLSPKWRGKLQRLFRDVVAMFMAVREPGVPLSAKLTTLASFVYLMLPVDLIPDFIPVLGWLDDIAMFPLLCHLAGKMMPTATLGRLRSDADFFLLRWGPFLKKWLLVFVVVWLVLAAIGGLMLLRGGRDDDVRVQERRPDWEEQMQREWRNLEKQN